MAILLSDSITLSFLTKLNWVRDEYTIKKWCRHCLAGSVLVYKTWSLGSNPRSVFKMKRDKIFLRQLPLTRFLEKTLKVKIKLPWKSFSEIGHSQSTLNCRSHLSHIKTNAHSISGVRDQVVILIKCIRLKNTAEFSTDFRILYSRLIYSRLGNISS